MPFALDTNIWKNIVSFKCIIKVNAKVTFHIQEDKFQNLYR